jgi:hypothetical protein
LGKKRTLQENRIFRGGIRIVMLAILLFGVNPNGSWGADAAATSSEGKSTDTKEDDFQQTPYTRFGEFQSEEEEAEDTRFFQFGRFFGLGLGVGYQGATGNRGTLYQGGFPALEAKVLYWFDFNTAVALSLYNAKHNFSGKIDDNATTERYDVNLFRLGADFRYYFDTKDLTASLTFSNPYLTAGIGNYRKTQTEIGGGETGITQDSSYGFTLGAGLEFIVAPKKTYFNLEAKVHSVTFNDTGSKVELSGNTLDDTSGLFFSIVGSLLFTW